MNLNILSTVLSILSIITTIVYFYCKHKLDYWKRRGIPQLKKPNLLFGHFKDAVLFKSPPGFYLGELYKKTELPFVGFYIFHKPTLLLRDPEIIKQILIKDFNNFSDRNFAGSVQKDSIGMKNLFGLRNPQWKYLRSKITPTLTRLKLKQMFALMMKTGEPMLEYIKMQDTRNGVKVLDAQELNYKYTTDLIASVALGTEINSFNESTTEFTKAVHQFFHGYKRMVALLTVFFMPELVNLFGSPVLFDSDFVKKVFWEAMEKREKGGESRGDYIDSLLQLKNEKQNPIYKFEGENLLHQSGTFFSGFESSSTVAAFTLLELSRSTKYQELARIDILRAVEKNGWIYESFHDMKFLDQCIAESVRLHPPVSTVDRQAKEDYKIPGTEVIIEKGTAVYISLYGLHRDPKYFDNPDEFNPNRFNGKALPEAYIPYGAGPRMCVGVKAGQLHAKVTVAMILSEYEIYQSENVVTELDSRSTFTAACDGIRMEFRKISI